MSIRSGALKMGRSVARAGMTDKCLVTRSGEKAWDESSGSYVEQTVTVWDDICQLKAPTVSGKQAESGSQLVVVSQVVVHLPVEADGVMPGDDVFIVSSLERPDLAGRLFKIGAPFDGSQVTALRYRIEVADGR